MSMSGSKGGIYEGETDLAGDEIDIVRYWKLAGCQEMSGDTLYQKLRSKAQPVQLEIGIGNSCGMTCEHCYLGYGAGSMESPLVPMTRLLEVTTELIENLHTRMICVADRDALTPGRSLPFFEHLARLREQQYPKLRFGGVTNGIRIPDFAEDLAKLPLDYIDISIDGSQHEHEGIRGAGRFDQVIDNLCLAQKHKVANRIIAAHTLTRYNDDSLIRLIHRLITQEKVEWFDIGPFMAVAPNMIKHQLHASDIVEFLESLSGSLHPLETDHPVTILVELCAYCAAFLPSLIDRGWLIPEQLRQDEYGHLYQAISINSSITIILRPELISEYWRHTLRISADGYAIGGCEPLTRSNYSALSVGNIHHERITDLYQKSLAVYSPFHFAMRSLDKTDCRSKACFRTCLGGDALLAKAVYDNYNQKDPNCIWDEYLPQHKDSILSFSAASDVSRAVKARTG